MRELKFRVWDKVKNRYLRQDSTGIDNLGNIIDFEDCDEDDWGVHNVRVLGKNDMGFTIEQSTGLKDKNGKTVYEGDILSEHSGDLKGVVKQASDGQWVIYWDNIPDGRSVLFEHSNFCGVIGNIHDTHELLEKNEKCVN